MKKINLSPIKEVFSFQKGPPQIQKQMQEVLKQILELKTIQLPRTKPSKDPDEIQLELK